MTNNMSMREWNAEAYHRVSTPQFTWGQVVLDRLPLRDTDTVLDVGCGTGRLTTFVADRVPRGLVVAIDASQNMLDTAREYLRPRHGDRHRRAGGLAIASGVGRRSAPCGFDLATVLVDLHLLDDPRHRRCLSGARRPEQRLIALARANARRERLDRLGLVARRRVDRRCFEGRHDRDRVLG